MNHIQSPIEKQSVTRPEVVFWGPVIFAFASLIILGWIDNARGPIFPHLLLELNLTHFEGSLFFATASMVSVFGNFLVPVLLRRVSAVTALCMGIFCMFSFSVGVSFSDGLWKLLLSAVSFGLALGIIMVTLNIVIEESVPLAKRRQFLLGLHSLYGLAALMAPVLVAVILNSKMLWSQVFLPIAVICIPLIFIGQIINKKNQQNNLVIKNANTESIATSTKIIAFWSMALACYVSSELYLSTRIPLIYSEHLKFSLYEASAQLSYFFIGLFIGRIANSFLPATVSGKALLTGGFLISSLWMLFAINYFPQGIWFMGFLMAPCYPVIISEISMQAGTNFKKVSSLCIAWSSMAVVGMHLAAGFIADIWGLKASLYIPFILLGLVPVLLVLFWPVKTISIAASQTLTD